MSDRPEVTYLLPKSIRDALLNYLSSRPYIEVAQGIEALQSLQPDLPPHAAEA